MTEPQLRTQLLVGGWCGFVGTLCYISAIFVPMPDMLSYFIIMLWPILSVAFTLALYRWLAEEGKSLVAQLGFLFAVVAFAMVAAMISVQLAVRMGFEHYLAKTPMPDKELSDLILDTARMVDMGLDVAWDMFIGSSLICIGVAMLRHTRLGKTWGVPAILFGTALIVLNVITFPFPPDTRGLFDIGPFIGVYILAIAMKMIADGRKIIA